MAALEIARKTGVITKLHADICFADLLSEGEPVILKNFAKGWPLVEAGLTSPDAAMDYVAAFHNGKAVVAFTGAPEIAGRFFYNDAMTGLNFEAAKISLETFYDALRTSLRIEQPSSHYLGSTDLEGWFPGLDAANHLSLDEPMFAEHPPIKSIWMGNRTTACAHYDMSNNLAICVAGRRRFTLFPPAQISNLYPGPLEPTPGGQVVSMVDITTPDLERFPRFAEALAAGEVAELEPGDVLFYPALWWHHVEALDPFNILINYWWNTSPAFLDSPQNTLLHAMLSLRDRPFAEKEAWRALFDYYIFGDAEFPFAHLPQHIQGNLAPLDDPAARRLRAMLISKLNR